MPASGAVAHFKTFMYRMLCIQRLAREKTIEHATPERLYELEPTGVGERGFT
jgi:hypothetical protein